MIDTVILSIPKEKVTIVKGSVAWQLQSQTNVYDKFVRNPSAKDLESGLYFPRLTGFHRKGKDRTWNSTIKIEFSAPKLLYKNNLDELRENQFEAVIIALHERLSDMGVMVTKKVLESAEVTAVHYSKNVLLTNNFTAQYVISELGRINLRKNFDLTKVRYMNEGQSVCAYSVSHSFVIYDKVADLTRGKKRSIDREQSMEQLSLFVPLRKNTTEILRFEVRLSQKRKMNSVFKQLGFSEYPTFKDVFSENKSKKVLWDYWQKMIENNSLLLFAYSFTAKDILKQIFIARNGIKSKFAIYLTGLIMVAREDNGLRELRSVLEKGRCRNWYRIIKDLKEISGSLKNLKPREWFEQVKTQLLDYKPLHMADIAV